MDDRLREGTGFSNILYVSLCSLPYLSPAHVPALFYLSGNSNEEKRNKSNREGKEGKSKTEDRTKRTYLTCALGAKATRLPILGLPPPKLIV
jgi:hypothetical protein